MLLNWGCWKGAARGALRGFSRKFSLLFRYFWGVFLRKLVLVPHSEIMECYTFTRAGSSDVSGSTWMHKTAAFSGSLSHGATLLVLREDREVRTFLITKSDDSKVAAEHLADAVGATCSTTDLPIDELACGASVKVVTKMKQPIMFSSVQELDMAHASGALSRALGPHSWVAISMRNPKSLESNRHSRWVLSRSGSQTTTHRSTSTGAQVVSIMVGAPTRGEVKSLV